MSAVQSCRWYALHVRSQFEHIVSHQLRELGIKEFTPYRLQSRERSSFARQPLFPGYVFCRTDLNRGPRLYTIHGVIRIVGHGNRPIAIEDAEMEAVVRIAEGPIQVDVMQELCSGDMVRLVAGPFAGVSGIFLHSKGQNKLVIALPLLHRSLAVAVSPEWVIPCK